MAVPSFEFLNPMKHGLFSRSPGPDAKNQGYNQLIKMKLCMSHDSHKSMSEAKFESGKSSISGDTTSQNFFLRKGISHRILTFTPGK